MSCLCVLIQRLCGDARVFSLPMFSSNLEDNLTTLFGFLESLSEYESNILFVFWILWVIWKSRNEYLFDKRNVHPIEDVHRAIDANMEWHRNDIHTTLLPRRHPVKSYKWDPPPRDWVKCNFDYSSSSGNSQADIGWILRDDKGRFLGAGCVQVQKMQTSLEEEALAFLLVANVD